MKKGNTPGAAREYLIRRPEQIEALASPLRQAIVDAVTASGPLTITQLARVLDRKPSALYHHVARLEQVGLLCAAGRGEGLGRPATSYDVPGRPMLIHYAPGTKRSRTIMDRVVSAMLTAAARNFSRGFLTGTQASGPQRSLWASRAEGWLTDAELRRLNSHLQRALDLMHSRAAIPPSDARAHSLTFVLAPRSAGND